MKLIACALALVALTQATDDIDWSTKHVLPVFPDKYYNLPSQKIAGGIEAAPNSIPYQVALTVTKTDGDYFCGGSLISTKYVLTSADCVDGGISVEVILGAHRVNEAEETQVRVISTKIIIHSGYNGNYGGDLYRNNIAVVELPSAVELNDNIKTINIPSRIDNDYAYYPARISGWGLESNQATAISPVLRYVYADVLRNGLCGALHPHITGSDICTNGTGGVGTCSGDNGGPLVADGKLIGIGSSSDNGCETGNPTVFSRVTYFRDWIVQNTDVVIN